MNMLSLCTVAGMFLKGDKLDRLGFVLMSWLGKSDRLDVVLLSWWLDKLDRLDVEVLSWVYKLDRLAFVVVVVVLVVVVVFVVFVVVFVVFVVLVWWVGGMWLDGKLSVDHQK